MNTLYLIRHGMTEANEAHLYCGSTDLSLSPRGVRALQALSYPIEGNVQYVTSGMKRTNETLRLLFGPVAFTTEPGFREVNFGVFELHSYEELKGRADYQTWLTGDNDSNVPPGGESCRQMEARVLAAFEGLLAGDRDTVLVTHGGVIAILMAHLFPKEGKCRYQWQPRPGHGYVLREGAYKVLEPLPQKHV